MICKIKKNKVDKSGVTSFYIGFNTLSPEISFYYFLKMDNYSTFKLY